MSFDELNVQDAVISKVESVAIVSVAELKMSSTHSVVSFICGSNEAVLDARFSRSDSLSFTTQTLCYTVLFGTVTNPFISKQDDRSIQMNNQNT